MTTLFPLVVFGSWLLFCSFSAGELGWVTPGSVLGLILLILITAFVGSSLQQCLESPD